MNLYVFVNQDSKKLDDNQYKLSEDCRLISTTDDIKAIDELSVTMLIHASDIRDNSSLKNTIIHLSNRNALEWKIILFTHLERRLPGIANIGDTTYTWNEIKRSFPILPPQLISTESLVALYILCKGYVAGIDWIKLPEDNMNWWKIVKEKDFTTEIEGLHENEDLKIKIGNLTDKLKEELGKEIINRSALDSIVNTLIILFSEIEQKGRFL